MPAKKGKRVRVRPDHRLVIQAFLRGSGMSPEELASRAGMSGTTLRRILSGETSATPQLPAIFDAMGAKWVDVSSLPDQQEDEMLRNFRIVAEESQFYAERLLNIAKQWAAKLLDIKAQRFVLEGRKHALRFNTRRDRSSRDEAEKAMAQALADTLESLGAPNIPLEEDSPYIWHENVDMFSEEE